MKKLESTIELNGGTDVTFAKLDELVEEQKKKKIAIVGTAPSSCMDAPYDDDKWEIWTLGAGVENCKRITKLFELHTQFVLEEANSWNGLLPHLKEKGVNTVLGHANQLLPDATPFPKDELIEKFGSYFTSSIAWMIGYAILQKPDAIGLWGIDMMGAEEYCVAPETKILTSDLRWINAGEINIGDDLIGFDEHVVPNRLRSWRKATVEKADTLIRPCYRITLEDGTELISSAEHRWLTSSEHDKRWRKTEDLITSHHTDNKRPSKIIKLLNVKEQDQSWDAGYLAAAFDGEGYLGHYAGSNSREGGLKVGFAQNDNEMSRVFKEICADFGYELREYRKSDGSSCVNYHIANGKNKILEFLSEIRPQRLMKKFDANKLGALYQDSAVAVVKCEFIGEQEVIGLKTSTGTFVAEGFASHNSGQRPCCEYLLGIARGMNIPIIVAEESPLLRSERLYGFEHTALSAGLNTMRRELQTAIAGMEGNERKARDEKKFYEGQMAMLSQIHKRFG